MPGRGLGLALSSTFRLCFGSGLCCLQGGAITVMIVILLIIIVIVIVIVIVILVRGPQSTVRMVLSRTSTIIDEY